MLARFRAGQRKMAAALLDGSRILAAWPRDAEDTMVWQRPAAVQERVATKALTTNS